MKIQEILSAAEDLFPFEMQEDYDNSGPQVIFPDERTTGILFALDCTSGVLKEALKYKCNCIISHHPLFFKSVKSFNEKNPHDYCVFELIRHRISCISIHTNADKQYWPYLAKIMGFHNSRPLFPDNTTDIQDCGYGFYSSMDKPVSLKDLIHEVKNVLKLEHCVAAGDPDKVVSSVAVLNGSGGRMIERAIEEFKVDCVISGDIGYHQAQSAVERDYAVIDAGHFGTEKPMINFLHERFHKALTNKQYGTIKMYVTELESDPLVCF